MLKLLLRIILLLFPTGMVAQTLSVSTPQLAFDTTYENAPDSLPIIISNTLGYDVDVTGFRFYTVYGQPAFRSGRTSLTVVDQASETVWVTFAPLHNIAHNSEMVIENNSHRGAVTIDLTGQGRYSNAYYDSTENLSEENLKTALQNQTGSGYISLGYAIARDSMFMIVDNQMLNGQGASQNTIECIYTGRQAVGYVDRTDCQSNYSFNTEHTFPQGFFSSLEPMRSDLHHLYPTDDMANNVRANYPFGTVTSPTWQTGGSKYANGIFEPRDAQKGATARSMFYFVIRYQDYTGFLAQQETILRTWHANFPPGPVESSRNQKIFTLQANRNPFVDYPQLIDRIASISSFSAAPSLVRMDFSEPQVDYGYVASSITHVYRFSVVNNGNQPLVMSGFTLSPSSLFSFVNGTGTNATVNPGESLALDIALLTPPSAAINGTMNFNTNVSGQAAVSIPLHADGASPVGTTTATRKHPSFYPNPVSYELTVENLPALDNFIVTDATGRPVEVPFRRDHNASYFDFSSLASGVYVLSWEHGTKGLQVIRR